MRERTHGEGFATRAIHAGERPDPVTHAHNTPIYATATFAFDTAADKEAPSTARSSWDPTSYFYSRTGNPTNRALEEKVASLEGAEDCVVVGVGDGVRSRRRCSRTSTSRRPPGRGRRAVRDHQGAVGGGPPAARDRRDAGRHDRPRGGRGGDHRPRRGSCSSRRRRTRGCGCADLDAIADARPSARAHRRRRQHVPRAGPPAAARARRRPRAPRRDEVPVGARRRGVAASSRARRRCSTRSASRPTRSARRPARSRRSSCCAACGRCRSARRRARRTPRALAGFLEADPRVEWVRYPGLASHPDHAVASRLLGDRFGAMVTFKPRGGVAGMAAFTDHLRLCDIGVSLGDVYTLVYPRPKDGGIVRVSVGCEDVEDSGRLRLGCRSSRRAVGVRRRERSAPAERRAPRPERRPDREVDAPRHLVLGRPEPGLVAAFAVARPRPGPR